MCVPIYRNDSYLVYAHLLPYNSNHSYTTSSSWDVAAGSILIEEAGGAMTDLNNERWNLRTRKICGSNGGKVHDQILEALEEAGVI